MSCQTHTSQASQPAPKSTLHNLLQACCTHMCDNRLLLNRWRWRGWWGWWRWHHHVDMGWKIKQWWWWWWTTHLTLHCSTFWTFTLTGSKHYTHLTIHKVIRVPQTTEVHVQQEPDETHKHQNHHDEFSHTSLTRLPLLPVLFVEHTDSSGTTTVYWVIIKPSPVHWYRKHSHQCVGEEPSH